MIKSWTSLIIHILVLLISVAITATALLAFDTESSRGETTSALWTGTRTNIYWKIWDIAPGTSYESLKATVAAGVAGLIAGFLAISHLFEDTENKRLYRGSFASCVSLLATIIGFPWAFAATYSSDKVYRGPFDGVGTVGDQGSYSVESWACQTVSLRVPGHRGQIERTCALAVSTDEQGCHTVRS
jgi:hypothetical protein